MKQYLDQFNTWWAARQIRERQILVVGAIAVAVSIFYLAIWEPVARAQRKADAALRQSRTVANRLETNAVEVQRSRGTGGGFSSLPLLTAVDQAAKRPELGKAPSRIQPENDKEVKLWLDEVPFDALVSWLQILQTQYGIAVASAELEKKGEGLVNARLSLVRP
jgi:general secretion pathway protein M